MFAADIDGSDKFSLVGVVFNAIHLRQLHLNIRDRCQV